MMPYMEGRRRIRAGINKFIEEAFMDIVRHGHYGNIMRGLIKERIQWNQNKILHNIKNSCLQFRENV